MTDSLVLPPLSLYIHIPWCIKKCPYCDFNSHEYKTIPEDDYVGKLLEDLRQDLHWVQGRKLCSIFFGGGTPSLFSAESIAVILCEVEKLIGFEAEIEITLEANPGTFEQDKFRGFRAAGINRLSIGIQSFQDAQLNALGRVHSAAEAERAVAVAKSAGFDNINLDLMHGLPKQSLAAAMRDLEMAVQLEPQHISWYQLTIEPNTLFYRQPPVLPLEEALLGIQVQGLQYLTANGYQQYEVSAFARDAKASRHNNNYWQFGDYLGIGAGAHGKVSDTDSGKVIRRQKTRQPEHYLANSAAANFKQNIVDRDQLPLEFFMNALRLLDGVPTDYFQQRTGVELAAIIPRLNKLKERKLLTNTDSRLQTTELGLRFLNSVVGEFT
ncbi:MAG: putative oxygen-independent coproporphyrinogen III oxidase [Cellvibrionaceae bacterium]